VEEGGFVCFVDLHAGTWHRIAWMGLGEREMGRLLREVELIASEVAAGRIKYICKSNSPHRISNPRSSSL
jgi:hypothetical protein